MISQSGETADTLAAQREAKRKGSPTLAICNVVGSMITREAAGSIITHAGPEIGVASTKAFTTQLTALLLLAMHLGQSRGYLDEAASLHLVQELLSIPAKLERVLAKGAAIESISRDLHRASDFLFLGRGIHFPIALEGALKLIFRGFIKAQGHAWLLRGDHMLDLLTENDVSKRLNVSIYVASPVAPPRTRPGLPQGRVPGAISLRGSRLLDCAPSSRRVRWRKACSAHTSRHGELSLACAF